MKISVCIPCYEMNGRGEEMLYTSLKKLRNQTFQDFEVIVSDDSKDAGIKSICETFTEMSIRHYFNSRQRGSSSNLNNAINHSNGELIKILCQDDYLPDDGLQTVVDNFDYNKGWLVTGYTMYFEDSHQQLVHTPEWNPNIKYQNSIGTHSCLTILNDNPLMFDENLVWYMDCEYYDRLYKRYGLPVMIEKSSMIQRLWEGQVTNTLVNSNLVDREKKYLEELK